MIKLFKSHILIIFMMFTFSLSQVANVHAKYLQKNTHRENSFISAIEQKRKNIIHPISLYTPNLNHDVGNEITIEGKIVKVLEPLTIGTFGIGMVIGYAASTAGMFLGWIIGKIISYFKSH
ncbi:hypothetical protein MNL13_01380 [Bartonella krasnovii]|uniref:Protein-disulfide reductase n=1 Tax=Bartonella krasnovii TaxID=2267275 RepID=A0ABY3VVP4_9HYPH|nr:hypothetical protein [Bartonella krasnovii]UNF29458.1 hypothetical protein MNL13_01380 [Bartonella krasnovii]UNF35816.1 hypothetical protein MNL12_01380 [Bartonella krasnovii]UNF37437.1 hypothetical protein MNL11_01385 [Bartonella krasnovii]UNF49003.1 hypothetical protein MNL04_01370 [Bartonella krasnovii]